MSPCTHRPLWALLVVHDRATDVAVAGALALSESNGGIDLTLADLIIGTSAGSTVAAQITSGTPPTELYAAILAEVPQPRPGATPSDRRQTPVVSGPSYLEWSNRIINSAEHASDMRRKMGAAALENG